MKPELTLLAWSVILAIVHMLIAVQGALNQVGLMNLIGNRENFPEIQGWGGRAAPAATWPKTWSCSPRWCSPWWRPARPTA